MKAELLIIIIPLTMLTVWAIWYNLSNKYHNWRYKPENDRARKGRGPTSSRIGEPTLFNAIPTGIEERRVLEDSSLIKDGKDSNSFRGFFAKFRKK